MDNQELPVFVKWMEFLEWLLAKTELFPKKTRFTFVNRIENLSLDIMEDLIEAKYTKEKKAVLKRANLRLEKLRILLRLACNRNYLNIKGYEYGVKTINEAGRMLGGWIKEKEHNETLRLSI